MWALIKLPIKQNNRHFIHTKYTSKIEIVSQVHMLHIGKYKKNHPPLFSVPQIWKICLSPFSVYSYTASLQYMQDP